MTAIFFPLKANLIFSKNLGMQTLPTDPTTNIFVQHICEGGAVAQELSKFDVINS